LILFGSSYKFIASINGYPENQVSTPGEITDQGDTPYQQSQERGMLAHQTPALNWAYIQRSLTEDVAWEFYSHSATPHLKYTSPVPSRWTK